ncbi:MAG: Maf family nucleotide pyrophosphatase [Gammaproteobacteria bacterium]
MSHAVLRSRLLILASTSRYRRELLFRLGLPFEARSPDTPELAIEGEAPAAMAARLALAKARSIDTPDAVVIGSDQVASLGGQLLRKPGHQAAAVRQLEACQGKTVTFDTAVAVIDTRTGATREHVDRTEVRFSKLETAALERYVQREQPLDCAGSFKAEGLGVALFERIDSSDPTALIGLPLIWLARALRELGVDPLGPSDS